MGSLDRYFDPDGRERCWWCQGILRIDQEHFCSDECERHYEWIAENTTLLEDEDC